MKHHSWVVIFTISLGALGWSWVAAQSNGGAAPSGLASQTPTAPAKSAPASTAAAVAAPASAASAPADDDQDAGPMQENDFLVYGVPSAKVLYMEGNVWVRPPGEDKFHRLTDDEPLPAQSVLYTGFNGILDFATGPGMAIRMVPKTALKVKLLPEPSSSPTVPAASLVAVKRGTIFSALGREDGNPIDFQVQTPLGIAGARGTMFSTTVTDGQAEVNMLHGTVNFETPDHQTSLIHEGQSQQIAGLSAGKFQFRERRTLNPENSGEFFNHAGGLLEHASGYGAVRHGLGPDVVKALHQRGYKMPGETEHRFQNAGQLHYHHRPWMHARKGQGQSGKYHPNPAHRETQDHHSNESQWNRRNKEKDKDDDWGRFPR